LLNCRASSDNLDNQIDDISEIKGLPNLTELDLGNNQISDISALSDLTEMQILSLYKNQINDISALSGLTHSGGMHMMRYTCEKLPAGGVPACGEP
jgi:Leucine-rich repeat (LRR) protein